MNKVVVLSFVIAIALSASIIMAAEANQQISLQGRLTDVDGKSLDGTYIVKFELFDVETGGTSLWSETQTITVDNGLFQTRLGSVTAFPDTVTFDKPYWVEITVDNDVLSPRYVLAASPYTIRALPEYWPADMLEGNIDIGIIPPNSITGAQIKDGTITGGDIGAQAINDAKITLSGITRIADGAITAAKIAANAVSSAKIKDGEVKSADLGSGAVTSAKIGTGAVTKAKIANDAVDKDKVDPKLFRGRHNVNYEYWRGSITVTMSPSLYDGVDYACACSVVEQTNPPSPSADHYCNCYHVGGSSVIVKARENDGTNPDSDVGVDIVLIPLIS